MLFSLANLTYWIFLGVGISLFLLVIFSGGGDDDLELEAEVGADVDVDGDGDFGSLQFLGWLGFGKTPLILLLAIDLSLWGLSGWMANVAIASILNEIPTRFWGWGGLILVGSLVFSLFVGSLIARPLGYVFASFGEDAKSDRLVGCDGVVTSKKVPFERDRQIGQADVRDAARNLVTVSICLPNWAKVKPSYGQEILIIEQTSDCYLVVAKDSEDEAEWLSNTRN